LRVSAVGLEGCEPPASVPRLLYHACNIIQDNIPNSGPTLPVDRAKEMTITRHDTSECLLNLYVYTTASRKKVRLISLSYLSSHKRSFLPNTFVLQSVEIFLHPGQDNNVTLLGHPFLACEKMECITLLHVIGNMDNNSQTDRQVDEDGRDKGPEDIYITRVKRRRVYETQTPGHHHTELHLSTELL
jgi:hypothetical protein